MGAVVVVVVVVVAVVGERQVETRPAQMAMATAAIENPRFRRRGAERGGPARRRAPGPARTSHARGASETFLLLFRLPPLGPLPLPPPPPPCPTSPAMAGDVATLLAHTLEADTGLRSAAEAQLRQLEAQDGLLGARLAQVAAEESVPLPVRHAAVVLIRQVIDATWSPISARFEGISGEAMPAEAKSEVRSKLLLLLLGPERKLRLAAALALSHVASTDFPDQMPELLPTLIASLAPDSVTPHKAHGALVFLTEFSNSELDEQQLLQLTNQLLPSLEAIVSNPDATDAHLQARAVNLVKQMIQTTYVAREQFPEAAQSALETVLPRWMPALLQLVQRGAEGLRALASGPQGLETWQQLALTTEVLQTLRMASHVKPAFKQHVSEVTLASLAVARAAADAQEAYETSPDAQGEPAGFPAEGDGDIASSIPGVASSAVETTSALLHKYPKTVSNLLQNSAPGDEGGVSLLGGWVELLAQLAMVTNEQEEDWSEDINAFVAELDEADGGGAIFGGAESLRYMGLETVSDLLEAIPTASVNALLRAVSARVQVGEAYRAQGRRDWWKPIEAILLLLGGNGDLLVDASNFDLEKTFELAVAPYVQNAPPLLTAQTFLFASQFASTLPLGISLQFLNAAALTLAGGDAIATAAATRTVRNFYRHFAANGTPPEASTCAPTLLSHLGRLLEDTRSAESGDTAVLVLEAVQAVGVAALSAGSVGAQEAATLAVGVAQTFLAQRDDPVVSSTAEDVLEAFVSQVQPPLDAAILTAALPPLAAHVVHPVETEVQLEGSVEGATKEDAGRWATRAASNLGCIDGLLRPAEPEALMQINAPHILLPAILGVWMELGEDREVQQKLVESLTYLIGKAPAPTLSWEGVPATLAPANMTSTRVFLAPVLSALLDPGDTTETAGLALGPFLCALIRREEGMMQQSSELLRALVARLQSAKTASLTHGILVPLLFLLAGSAAGVPPGPDALAALASLQVGHETGLTVVAQRWMQEAGSIHGGWARKVNALALLRLLAEGGDLLLALPVRGEVLPTPGKIVTRSMAKQKPLYREVPLAVGALTALLDEWDSSHSEDQPEEDAWDDDESFGGMHVSDLLDLGMMDEAGAVDPAAAMGKKEWAADPVANLDLGVEVPRRLKELRPSLEAMQAARPGLWDELGEKYKDLMAKVMA